jgi:hypothetical protein
MKGISTKRILIIITLLVCIGGGAIYGVYYMIRSNIQKTIALENAHAELESSEEAARVLRSSLEVIGPEIDKLSSRIIEANGVVDFIEMIESRARRLGVSIEVQTAAELDHESSDKHKILELSFRTQGSWENTYKFVAFLESLPYQSTLNQMSLEEERTEKSSVWTGSYKLDVVRFK